MLRRQHCCLLSLLLTVCCSASSSSKRSHSFTSVLCFTLASMKHLRCHSYDLQPLAVFSVCISKVSPGCKQATNAQQTTTDRRTDVRHKWSRRSRRQLSESVKAPWLSLIGSNKERFSHLEWSVLAFEMLLNLSVSQVRARARISPKQNRELIKMIKRNHIFLQLSRFRTVFGFSIHRRWRWTRSELQEKVTGKKQ